MQKTILRLERMRERNREYFDSKRNLREYSLNIDNIVLLYNTADQYMFYNNIKFRYRWHNPYKIIAVKDREAYTLKELDGISIKGSLRPDGI